MAGEDQRQRIRAVRRPHRAARRRIPDGAGDFPVAGAAAVGDPRHRVEDGALERGAGPVDRELELAALPNEEIENLTTEAFVFPRGRGNERTNFAFQPPLGGRRTPAAAEQDRGQSVTGAQQFETPDRGDPGIQRRSTAIHHRAHSSRQQSNSRSQCGFRRYASIQREAALRCPVPLPSPSAFLFDWDGTLADSFAVIQHASLAVFRHFGIAMDEELYRSTYRPDWHETYRQLGIPEDRWTEAGALWRKKYDERSREVALFPGALAVLTTLAEAGARLGVVTTADRDRFLEDLDRCGLSGRFGAVVAFEDARRKKPHPEALLLALGRLGMKSSEALYAGDRPEDVAMGKQAGTLTAAVVSRFSGQAMLRTAEPDFLLRGIGELPGALAGKAAASETGRGC